ncbi:MAG: SH3 domain-containing protein [Candidatus Omnitrophica bacterium]|nr:SH3 domain-containing protein [Candidatus Omnitrophota bacterium]MBU4303097.1 SH3 domain-containing protein [Candidatus Omnitrophota bacterium]MBU4468220.1 SH3 domain-containing protein [Candidatus Omnitrophota bacterium]MCG2707262.1 SH3 domain-containing protein [Candidatus Omnitrophota bacterium]
MSIKTGKKVFAGILFITFFWLILKFCLPHGQLKYAAPTLLPHTEWRMKCSGFWIGLHPYPDRVILNSAQVSALNLRTETEPGLINNILNIGPFYQGGKLRENLRRELGGFLKGRFYNAKGWKTGNQFYRRIEENTRIENIPSTINVRYGFILGYVDQRVLPARDIITAVPFDFDFDELQNSSLDAGTPLAILHETIDKEWFYAVTPASSGWVQKKFVAVCSYSQMADYLKKDFCVVTAAKTGIFWDSVLTQYYEYARMGAKFAINSQGVDSIGIIVPFYDEKRGFYERTAYLKKEDVSIGFLPYTPRTVIEQAFKMLNAPYGWGGVNGEQDCSSFLQEIFATVGILLPRNSADQAKAGIKTAEFKEHSDNEKKLLFLARECAGGVNLLKLKGHIVLYLGQFNGRFYVIHETSGYRERVWWHDRVRVLRRVVVSDLSLGQGSAKGALLGF